MTYENALAYIHSTLKFGIKPGLHRIERLLADMGNPQDNLKYIHIAGTNGKGSTSTMTANVLSVAGYKTGLFISPYIEDFCERISINGKNIRHEELSTEVENIIPYIDKMRSEGFEHPTEFEIITAVAFSYYNKMGCDFVVLEVGLGGGLDSTNVIKSPLVSVITSISFDHTEILGDTIEKIANEKCGIIKENSNVVLYPLQKEEVFSIVENTAKQKKSRLFIPDIKNIKIISQNIEKTYLEYKQLKIDLYLGGEHQIYNLSTAIETLNVLIENGLNISNQNIIDGIAKTKVPGRLEILSKDPLVLIDGAHNLSGIMALCNTIDTNLSKRHIVVLMGMLKDKEYEACINEISKRANEFIGVAVNNPRTLSAEQTANIARNNTNAQAIDDINSAVKKAISLLRDDSVLIICGSLYLIGDVKTNIRQ